MSYCSLILDCPRCNKRFHYHFDDESPTFEQVAIACRSCGASLSQASHPAVVFDRDENLIGWEKHFFNKDRFLQDYGKMPHGSSSSYLKSA